MDMEAAVATKLVKWEVPTPGLIPRGYPHKAIIDLLPAPATGCRLVLAQPNRLFFLTQDARIRFYATVMICHRRDCSVGLHIS